MNKIQCLPSVGHFQRMEKLRELSIHWAKLQLLYQLHYSGS